MGDTNEVIATVINTSPTVPVPNGMVVNTPGAAPNVVLHVVQPFVAIIIRFINAFLTALVGLVVAGMTPEGGKLLYTSDFIHLVATCAALALPAAGLGLIKDLVTVFGKLEGKYPLLTGSV